MALLSCGDTDDSSQKQAKIAESLDFSVALYVKVNKNDDHHDTHYHHTASHLSNKMMCVSE